MKINRAFYLTDGLVLARNLLGKALVHNTAEGITKGRITEVEAYMGEEDKASHSYKNRKTPRTEIQYGEGGFAYIYMIYGMHNCMNIVANQEGVAQAVLIRALEPVQGIELMEKRRNSKDIRALCSGPGRLCQAMGITKAQYGMDLCGKELYLEDAPALKDEEIEQSKRINIDYSEEARDFLWRFSVKNCPYVSR